MKVNAYCSQVDGLLQGAKKSSSDQHGDTDRRSSGHQILMPHPTRFSSPSLCCSFQVGLCRCQGAKEAPKNA